jgi:hypothetical protein
MQRGYIFIDDREPADLFQKTVVGSVIVYHADFAYKYFPFSGLTIKPVIHSLFKANALPG